MLLHLCSEKFGRTRFIGSEYINLKPRNGYKLLRSKIAGLKHWLVPTKTLLLNKNKDELSTLKLPQFNYCRHLSSLWIRPFLYICRLDGNRLQNGTTKYSTRSGFIAICEQILLSLMSVTRMKRQGTNWFHRC